MTTKGEEILRARGYLPIMVLQHMTVATRIVIWQRGGHVVLLREFGNARDVRGWDFYVALDESNSVEYTIATLDAWERAGEEPRHELTEAGRAALEGARK